VEAAAKLDMEYSEVGSPGAVTVSAIVAAFRNRTTDQAAGGGGQTTYKQDGDRLCSLLSLLGRGQLTLEDSQTPDSWENSMRIEFRQGVVVYCQ
jgi:hypothetical protein